LICDKAAPSGLRQFASGMEAAMSYIRKALAERETLRARAHLHWLLWLRAWAALIFLGIFLYGIYFFVKEALRLVSTEIAVTDRRVIRKTGFLERHVMDMQLVNVEAVNLDQDFWGRLFGYGRITLHGTGDDSLATPMIANPLAFQREIESAMSTFQRRKERTPTPASAPAVSSVAPAH
jgi:uncharacterized membrane protein YdbT with pleckstrin-like domain